MMHIQQAKPVDDAKFLFTLFLEILLLMTRAAYKGFADTIRLLLFRDASQGRQDKDGMPSWPLILSTNCIIF